MLLLIVIVVVICWVAIVVGVVALARMASRGDHAPESSAVTRRRVPVLWRRRRPDLRKSSRTSGRDIHR
jgi:hypothetical protein